MQFAVAPKPLWTHSFKSNPMARPSLAPSKRRKGLRISLQPKLIRDAKKKARKDKKPLSRVIETQLTTWIGA